MTVVPDAEIADTTTGSHPVFTVDPTTSTDPADVAIDDPVTIVVVPAVYAAFVVDTDDPTATLDDAYTVVVTFCSRNGTLPGATGNPFAAQHPSPPTYTGYRPVFATWIVFVADVFGVNAHVGVTAGLTRFGVPGGRLGVRATEASSPRC